MAFSFGKNLGEAYQDDAKGRKVYLASFLFPQLFRIGVFVFSAGFVVQAAGEFMQLCFSAN
jgi:hypothetical protein